MLINRKKYQAWIKPVCSLKGMLDVSLKNCLLRPDSLSSLLERYMRNYSGSYLKKIMTQDSKSKHKTFPKHIYHYTKMAKRKMNRIINHNFFKIFHWKHFFFFFFFFFQDSIKVLLIRLRIWNSKNSKASVKNQIPIFLSNIF